MPTFQFQGWNQTHVELPDGSYRLTEVGEVADLKFKDPGPLWAPYKAPALSKAKAAKVAKAAADAAEAEAAVLLEASTPTQASAPESETTS